MPLLCLPSEFESPSSVSDVRRTYSIIKGMKRFFCKTICNLSACAIVSLLVTFSAHSQTSTAPAQASAITSLAAETANNTAANNSWRGSFNGVPKGGNVSPLPLSSLLPAGNTTKFIAHLVPFFTTACNSATSKCPHVDVGYEQNDTGEVVKQMADMRRRGFSVIALDWYGPEDTHADRTGQKIMHESERLKHEGADFSFMLMPDKGIAGKCDLDEACNTNKLVEALAYASKTYFNSPAYLRVNARPVVPLFWFDSTHPVNWDEISARVPGHPIFVFINGGGFSHPESGGAFAWEAIKAPPDEGLEYLDNFYKVAKDTPQDEVVIGSAYPGFDDRLASWGKGKIGVRRCGLTWLDSVNESLQYQKLTGRPLPFLQVVTWNDYEEGTAVEPGIDNCVAAIPAGINNNHLTWTVSFAKDAFNFTGSERTIAYYRIFTTVNGETIRELTRIPTKPSLSGRYALDLAQYNLQSGQKVYIEAVGKSMILNHMSDPISVP